MLKLNYFILTSIFLNVSSFLLVRGVTNFLFENYTHHLTLPIKDDAFTTIHLSFDFPFFGEVFRKIHVSTNGIIFFGEGSTDYVSTPFPLNGTKSVAAYWIDNNSEKGGNIFYREELDQVNLGFISNEINSKFINRDSFKSSWAFIVTFDNVPRFGCKISTVHPCQNVVNHQTILTSNGIESFVIFLYDKLGYSYAQIGFNAGDGNRYFMFPNSNKENISTYALQESNVGEPGKWMFLISAKLSNACSSNDLIKVSPTKVFHYGGQKVFITGLCFLTNQTHVEVIFGDDIVNCSITDNRKISCTSPYIHRIDQITILINHDGLNYTSFMEIEADLKEISEPCIHNINITNGDVIIEYDVNDAMNVVYHISCNTGFKLSGSATVKCIKGKYSEKFGNCQEYEPISSSSFSSKYRFENLMFTFVLVYLLFNLICFI